MSGQKPAENTVQRVVTHSKLFMMTEGKMTLIPKGTQITITKKQSKSGLMQKMTASLKDQKKIDATPKPKKDTPK